VSTSDAGKVCKPVTLGRRWKSAAIVFAIVFAAALVALATPQNRDMILMVSCDRVERDFGGGPGGRPAPDAQCDTGFVAVGFHVQTGEYYNEAWLDCAPLRSDGTLGEERRMTGRTGSPGGQAIHDARCSPGRALRGLRGRTGASIDEAVGVCSDVRDMMRERMGDRRGDGRDDRRDDQRGDQRDDRRDDRRAERFDPRGMEMTEPVTRPRPGGSPAEAQCPAGSVLTGFRSRSGRWMDHLWILCSDLQRSY
jgi:hypothetical protein